MLSTKKTNPSEFLLQQKTLWLDYTPSSYFSKFRLDLFTHKILLWFFLRFGLYFFLTKLKNREYSILLHLLYYKTYIYDAFESNALHATIIHPIVKSKKKKSRPYDLVLSFKRATHSPVLLKLKKYQKIRKRRYSKIFLRKRKKMPRFKCGLLATKGFKRRLLAKQRFRFILTTKQRVLRATIIGYLKGSFLDRAQITSLLKYPRCYLDVNYRKLQAKHQIYCKRVKQKYRTLRERRLQQKKMLIKGLKQVKGSTRKIHSRVIFWVKKQRSFFNRQQQRKFNYKKKIKSLKKQNIQVLKNKSVKLLKKNYGWDRNKIQFNLWLLKKNKKFKNKNPLKVVSQRVRLKKIVKNGKQKKRKFKTFGGLLKISKEISIISKKLEKWGRRAHYIKPLIKKKVKRAEAVRKSVGGVWHKKMKPATIGRKSRVPPKKYAFSKQKIIKKQHALYRLKRGRKQRLLEQLKIKRNKRKLGWVRFLKPRIIMKYLFFFHHFFIYWWQKPAKLLFKPLHQYLLSTPTLRKEFNWLLEEADHLVFNNWTFDFIVLLHTSLTLQQTGFFLPFFVFHFLLKWKHMRIMTMFTNMLEALFYVKESVQGVKVAIVGPYNRHGRTHMFLYTIGYVLLTSYHAKVVYDMIHCPTYFGMVSCKIWIYYKNELLNEKKYLLEYKNLGLIWL